MKKIWTKILVLTLILALGLFSAGCNFVAPTTSVENVSPNGALYLADDVKMGTLSEEDRKVLSLADAVEKVKNSCVQITVETYSNNQLAARSRASGTLIDVKLFDKDDNLISKPNEYYILTCHHVIQNTGKIIVNVPDENYRYGKNPDYTFTGEFDDKKETKQKSQEIYFVGGDSVSDIAVLKLVLSQDKINKGVGLTTAKVPDTKSQNPYSLKLAEEVFAIGNPTGELPGTVSAGIVSYNDRVVSFDGIGKMNCTQHNASISEGSSGGALFNMYGELVGVTNGGNVVDKHINYAIPTQSFFDLNNKAFVSRTEKETKNLTCEDRGFISTAERLISTETADNYGFIKGRWSIGITVRQEPSTNKLTVLKVVKGSIAEKANIKPGDTIISITYNGTLTTIDSTATFSAIVADMKNSLSSETRAQFTLSVSRNSVVQMYVLALDPAIQHIFSDTSLQYLE